MTKDHRDVQWVDVAVPGAVLVRKGSVPKYPHGGDPARRARLWRARQDELMVQRAARKLDGLLVEMYGEAG